MIAIGLIVLLFIGFIFLGISMMVIILRLDEQDKRYEEIKHKTNKYYDKQ
jgi:hypothetical protein